MNVGDVSRILSELGAFKVKNRSNGGLTANCPLAPYSGSHKGRDENPSLIVWHDSRNWACKCYACKFTGSLLDMVDMYGDLSGKCVADIKRFIRLDGGTDLISRLKRLPKSFDEIPDVARFGGGISGGSGLGTKDWSASGLFQPAKAEEEIAISEGDVSDWMSRMPKYAESRGLTLELAKEWEIGYARPLVVTYPKKGGGFSDVEYGPRMMFLIRNMEGKLVGWSGRALLPANKPKYIHARGTKLSKYLYGENHIDLSVKTGYVVEGFMDVLRLTKFGYKNVLAVMSGSLSKYQIDKLCSWFNEVVIVPDGDDAGLRMTLGVKEKIHGRAKLRVAGHIDGLDPGDFDKDTADTIISRSSEYVGISWNFKEQKWKSFLDDKGEFISLGSFETEVEAARAYDEAMVRLNGMSLSCNMNS